MPRLSRPWSTFLAGYYLASSRVTVVDDYFFPMYVIKPRRGTTRVQVWHAAGAFKKFGFSVLDKAFGVDDDFVAKVRIHSNYSVALVSSMSIAPHYAEAFGQPLDIFTSRIGVPRTDLFGDPERRARAEARVRATYPLPPGRRVILYAPTFRGETVGKARYADLHGPRGHAPDARRGSRPAAQAAPVRARRRHHPAGARGPSRSTPRATPTSTS